MESIAIRTHRVEPSESLFEIIDRYVPRLKEQSILAISAKIVSFCQNRLVPKNTGVSKDTLIRQEADRWLEPSPQAPHPFVLTMTHHLLIPSAGIDESNATQDAYVLYPENIQDVCRDVWNHLRDRDGLTHVGVLMTDSSTTPLRRGTRGVALGWCGFRALQSYIGTPDCYGRQMQYAVASHLDGLAGLAVLMMGEGAEQTPMVLVQDLPMLVFQEHPPSREEYEELMVDPEYDVYASLLRQAPWQS